MSEMFNLEIATSDYTKKIKLPFQCCTQTDKQSLQLKHP